MITKTGVGAIIVALGVTAAATAATYYHSPYDRGTVAQLQNQLRLNERRVRDLERQVRRLQDEIRRLGRSAPSATYPLTTQHTERGFQPGRNGSYTLELNGARMEIQRDGGILMDSPGDLTLRAAGRIIHDGTR